MTLTATSDRARITRERLLVALTLMVLPLIMFSPAILGSNSLAPADGWTQNYGVRVLLGQMIASFEWPLWNPLIFAGAPLMASVYPGALYPPNWIFALLAAPAAYKFVVLVNYHLALIGAYCYARRLGVTRAAGLAAGMMFAFGGFLIIHLAQPSRIGAAAWLPWILLALEHLAVEQRQRSKWLWMSAGACFLALQFFAGEHQMSLYTILLIGVRVVYLSVFDDRTLRRRSLPLWPGLMVVFGVLLSAIVLLPQFELLRQGDRAKVGYDYFASFSLPPRQMLSLIFPYFFGGAAAAPYHRPFSGLWNAYVMGSYAGLLGLMLALASLFGRTRRRETLFWLLVATGAAWFSFGDYLPFGLNRLLYQIPGYNLFRGSYRHMFEFSFAAAMMGALGLDRFARIAHEAVKRIAFRSVAIIGLLTAATAVVYDTGGRAGAQPGVRWTDAESLAPLLVFGLSGAALLIYAHRRNRASAGLLLLTLFLDLASFAFFFEWRGAKFDAGLRSLDPPAVGFIKSKERDPHSFRVLSIAGLPYDHMIHTPGKLDYEQLNMSNLSMVRGLESVNGYDTLRLGRFAAVTGEMDQAGVVQYLTALEDGHRGFDLLNVKYLLLKRGGTLRPEEGLTIAGVRFAKTPLHLSLSNGKNFAIDLSPVPAVVRANELAIASLLLDSVRIADGEIIAKILLHTTENRSIEREIKAGRDTAEWGWEKPANRGLVRHKQPPIAESTQIADTAGNFEGRSYLSRFSFDPAIIDRVEIVYARTDASLSIVHASLIDATTGTVTPLDDVPLPPERWKPRAAFGDVLVYENLRALPRAWFARELVLETRPNVVRIIKEGILPDGRPFDPGQTALLAREDGSPPSNQDFGASQTGAVLKMTSGQPQALHATTSSPAQAFLVLSASSYPGWEAMIDGVATPLYRVDHVLQGVEIPAGDHRLDVVYRPRSFRIGALISGFTLALLLLGMILDRRTTNRERLSTDEHR